MQHVRHSFLVCFLLYDSGSRPVQEPAAKTLFASLPAACARSRVKFCRNRRGAKERACRRHASNERYQVTVAAHCDAARCGRAEDHTTYNLQGQGGRRTAVSTSTISMKNAVTCLRARHPHQCPQGRHPRDPDRTVTAAQLINTLRSVTRASRAQPGHTACR